MKQNLLANPTHSPLKYENPTYPGYSDFSGKTAGENGIDEWEQRDVKIWLRAHELNSRKAGNRQIVLSGFWVYGIAS